MIGPIVNGPRVANDLVTNPVYLQLTTQTLAKYINILEKRFIHRSEMATNYMGKIITTFYFLLFPLTPSPAAELIKALL